MSVPEAATPVNSPVFAPGTPGEMQPPAWPVNLSSASSGIDWSVGRTSAIMAGIFIGITSFLPFNFLWILLGGVLAVRLYNKRMLRHVTGAGDGAKIGALAGLAGYVLFAIGMLAILRFAADKFWNLMIEVMKTRAAATGTNFQPVLDMLNSAEGKAFVATFLMVFVFALMLALSSLGGAIGAAFARRADHHR